MIQTILTRVVIPLLIIGAGGVAMLSMGKQEQGKKDSTTTSEVLEVQTEQVLPHTGGLDIQVDGVVTPHREIRIAAEVAGRVSEKDDSIRAGRFVQKGTPLLTIDTADYNLALEQARQQQRQVEEEIRELGVQTDNVLTLIELAKRDVALQQDEFERTKRLYSDTRTSKSQLDQAERGLIVAENSLKTLENQLNLNDARRDGLQVNLDLAKTQYQRAELDLERTQILAPVDGVIVSDSVERGGYVRKGDILFVVEDTSSVEVQCKLQMEDLYWIWRQAGSGDGAQTALQALAYQIPATPVTVTYQLAARKDLKFTWQGVLSRYESIGVDERTRTVPCRVVVSEPRQVTVSASNRGQQLTGPAGPPALVRGMYVAVQIHAKPFAEFVKVPEACVHPGKRIWRLKDNGQGGQVLERLDDIPLAKLVEESDEEDRVLKFWIVPASDSGLRVGDQLVSVPVPGMRPDMPAKLLNTKPEGPES